MPGQGNRMFVLFEKYHVYAPPCEEPQKDGAISVVLTTSRLTPLVIAIRHAGKITLMKTDAVQEIRHEYFQTGGRDVLMALALRVYESNEEGLVEAATSPYRYAQYWKGAPDKSANTAPVQISKKYYKEGMFK